ncbi:MAG: MoaD/ThiS family protein [Dehalococcoidales bacterium]|jgi:molybdopterin converting factor small subunit|nr:ThiS family protein [Dehalococcoidales bacterium]MDP6501084.1 MoaD/ThiS family protein [Dehalococcoidales bacterium]|tara:strand:+ start:250 stop:534 length:285 start_codon:yes stop_codon:yes gene_type:complete
MTTKVSAAINIPQFFQHLVDGVKVTKTGGRTVGECLDELIERFPQLEAHLFSGDGKLHGYLDVFINGESAYPEELSKPVADGDELHIINIIVGG